MNILIDNLLVRWNTSRSYPDF